MKINEILAFAKVQKELSTPSLNIKPTLYGLNVEIKLFHFST